MPVLLIQTASPLNKLGVIITAVICGMKCDYQEKIDHS
jgi:hypothetical protein